jgi:hypothetical protein
MQAWLSPHHPLSQTEEVNMVGDPLWAWLLARYPTTTLWSVNLLVRFYGN